MDKNSSQGASPSPVIDPAHDNASREKGNNISDQGRRIGEQPLLERTGHKVEGQMPKAPGRSVENPVDQRRPRYILNAKIYARKRRYSHKERTIIFSPNFDEYTVHHTLGERGENQVISTLSRSATSCGRI